MRHYDFLQVILGDAIVCWRACVVWHESYVAKAVCGGFLVATCGKLSTLFNDLQEIPSTVCHDTLGFSFRRY